MTVSMLFSTCPYLSSAQKRISLVHIKILYATDVLHEPVSAEGLKQFQSDGLADSTWMQRDSLSMQLDSVDELLRACDKAHLSVIR